MAVYERKQNYHVLRGPVLVSSSAVVATNLVLLFGTLLTVYLSFDSVGRTFCRLQKLIEENGCNNPEAVERQR